MKQASDSLLTLYPIRSTKTRIAAGYPRDKACAVGCLLTPFHVHRKKKQMLSSILPGRSCPPHSFIHARLGEGSIRSLLHRISFLFILAVIAQLPGTELQAASGMQIQLKTKAYVGAGNYFLKDIAFLAGMDSGWINKIGNIPIACAPEFGAVQTLSRHQIETIIRQSGADIPETSFSGAAIVQIRIQGRQARAEELIPVLKSFFIVNTPWLDPEIEIRSITNLEEIELPPGEIELRISAKTPIVGKQKILAPIDVIRNGKILSCFWVAAEVRIRAEILAARKIIPYRKVIAQEDIVSIVKEIENLNESYIRDAEMVLGKVSKRQISPGDPLTRESYEKPFLVNSGDTINLRLEKNGFVLTSLVRAEQDGRLGQVIRVRNLEFSTVLEAKVTGPDKVELP